MNCLFVVLDRSLYLPGLKIPIASIEGCLRCGRHLRRGLGEDNRDRQEQGEKGQIRLQNMRSAAAGRDWRRRGFAKAKASRRGVNRIFRMDPFIAWPFGPGPQAPRISPANALAATVAGLANHICPGPLRPGKLRLMALMVT